MTSTVDQYAVKQMDAALNEKGFAGYGIPRSTYSSKLKHPWDYPQRLSSGTVNGFSAFAANETWHEYPNFSDKEVDTEAVEAWMRLVHKIEEDMRLDKETDTIRKNALNSAILNASSSILDQYGGTTLLQSLARGVALTQIASREQNMNAASDALDLTHDVIEEIGVFYNNLTLDEALGERQQLLEHPQSSPAGIAVSSILAYGDMAAHILKDRHTYLSILKDSGIFSQLAVRGRVLKTPPALSNFAEMLFIAGNHEYASRAIRHALDAEPDLRRYFESKWANIYESEFTAFALELLEP